MHTVVGAANILVQDLLFRKVFHCMSIISDLSICFLFILIPILNKGTITF